MSIVPWYPRSPCNQFVLQATDCLDQRHYLHHLASPIFFPLQWCHPLTRILSNTTTRRPLRNHPQCDMMNLSRSTLGATSSPTGHFRLKLNQNKVGNPFTCKMGKQEVFWIREYYKPSDRALCPPCDKWRRARNHLILRKVPPLFCVIAMHVKAITTWWARGWRSARGNVFDCYYRQDKANCMHTIPVQNITWVIDGCLRLYSTNLSLCHANQSNESFIFIV